jgi:SulP family sulfate permease
VVAGGTLGLILVVLWVRPRWPATLIAVATATAVSAASDLAAHGVASVGRVPSGLPGVHLPLVSMDDLQTLAIAGLGVAVVAYSDNMLIGRAFVPAPDDTDLGVPGIPGSDAERPQAEIDPQQELVALGAVHLASGLVGGFPVSSSGSRTALAIASRARSQLYSLVAGGCIVVVLFAAGPLLSALPSAALGGVVIYAASKLVSGREFVRLARFRPTELVLAVVALLGTVLFGILAGVAVAIALSLLEMAQRLARPHEGVLGRVPGLAGMHDVDDYPEATTLPGLVVYRYDAPLFFANVGDLRRRALLVVEQENAADPENPVRWFVLNVEANVEIDITAADGLRALHEDLAARGVRLGLARVKRDLLLPLQRAGLRDLIGDTMLFPTLPVAEEAYVTWASDHVKEQAKEQAKEHAGAAMRDGDLAG